jgi:hypothetical protein
MSFTTGLKRKGHSLKSWILKHSLWGAGIASGVMMFLYYNVLNIRTQLEGGYFSVPSLTTTSEILWFLMGIFLLYFVTQLGHTYFKGRAKR